jgi:pimeloyl-ACP methyl ester carboxylesterase
MPVHYVEHGTGRPVPRLHGAGVDHREAEACFELTLGGVLGLRRIYPDLPGMGRTTAPATLRSADVLDTLLDFADEVIGGTAPTQAATRVVDTSRGFRGRRRGRVLS